MKKSQAKDETSINALLGRIHIQCWRYEKRTGKKPTLLFISGSDRDSLAYALGSYSILHDMASGRERFRGMEIVITYGRHGPVVGEEYSG